MEGKKKQLPGRNGGGKLVEQKRKKKKTSVMEIKEECWDKKNCPCLLT